MPERGMRACLILLFPLFSIKIKLQVLIMRVINHRNEVPREVKNYPQFQLFLIKVDDYPTVMLPLHQVTGFGTEIHGKTLCLLCRRPGMVMPFLALSGKQHPAG